MSGRVTRRKRRATNSAWSDWVLVCSTPLGECADLRHEKFVSGIRAHLQLFGPFDDLRVADCGCEFVMLPVSGVREDCGMPIVDESR